MGKKDKIVKKSDDERVVFINLSEEKTPVFSVNEQSEIITFGENNLYPNVLLDIFNRHPEHNAIVTGKADYILGKRLYCSNADAKLKAIGDAWLDNANRFNTWYELTRKNDIDNEIFDGYYIQITTDLAGRILEYYHLPFANCRWAKDLKHILYNECWGDNAKKDEFVKYPIYQKGMKGTAVIPFKYYRPSSGKYSGVYPLPVYQGAIASIETDILITNYHYNNVKNGFSGSVLVSFFNGEPSVEEKKKIVRQFNEKFGGTDGDKILLNFADRDGKGIEIQPLTASDLDKQFDVLSERIQQKVITGHKVSGVLFGIKTAGQLGNATEIKEAYELVMNTYVQQRQSKKLQDLSKLCHLQTGVWLDFAIDQLKPIGADLSDPNISKYFTEDEIRKSLGFEPKVLDVAAAADNNNDALNSLSPLVATKVLETMTEDEIRSLAGLPPKAEGQLLPTTKMSKEKLTLAMEAFDAACIDMPEGEIIHEEFLPNVSGKKALEHEFKLLKQNFQVTISAKSLSKSILDLVKGNPFLTEKEIAKQLGVPVADVTNSIKGMAKKNIIDTSEGTITPTEKGLKQDTPISETVTETVYQFIEAPTAPKLKEGGKSRPWCIKELKKAAANKVYTREALDNLTNTIGEDAWAFRGGFYTNPDTGETTPYCRHIWKSITISTTKKLK